MAPLRRRGGGDADAGAASFASLQFFGRNRLFACLDADEMDEWCASPAENEIKGSATQRFIADIEEQSDNEGPRIKKRAVYKLSQLLYISSCFIAKYKLLFFGLVFALFPLLCKQKMSSLFENRRIIVTFVGVCFRRFAL